MDPLNQLNVMRLQEPLPTALDLSMGCRQIPVKASSMEALNLVKKASSGSNSRTAHESHISKFFKHGPDSPHLEPTSRFGYESRYCTVPLHKSNSSSPLLNGLPSVAHIICPCPPLNTVITEDGVDMDEGFPHRSRNSVNTVIAVSQDAKTDADTPVPTRRTTRGGINALNGLGSQSKYIKAGCGGRCMTDTVLRMTTTKGFLVPQDSTSPTPSLHSTSSLSIISEDSLRRNPTSVETLSSECAFSDESSRCSVEYISSDDSDVIEVPVTCKASSSSHFLARSITVERISHESEALSSPRPESDLRDGIDCGLLKHACHNDDLGLQNIAETLESSEVSSPTAVQDSDLETDEFVSKNVPSTSEAENADALKPPPSSSLSPQSPKNKPPSKRTPTPKRKKRTKTVTKKKSPGKKRAKPSPRSKAVAGTTKRKRKKSRPSGTSTTMFTPEEPEIKLKYANHKDEKREGKSDGFAPYIRMDLSACTVVNFQEDDGDVRAKKSRLVSSVASGIVPTSSCLQLGRVSLDSRSRPGQLCCLCGRTANSIGLGDLHGPYYPYGAQPDLCNVPTANGAFLDREEKSPELLREHSDCGERWIHEDCSIWSAGVFLVKGKLYGLEEAVRLAQETECSCCHRAGATLGCFFKGCPNKYHFPCSLQAGCFFIEENFTIRCPKHKYKSPRTSLSRLHYR